MIRSFAFLSLLCVVAGCPVYGPEPVQRTVDVSCIDDFDCPRDAYCDPVARRCVGFEFGICLTDGDCPAGSYCERSSGYCLISDVEPCRADRDCFRGFECDFRNTCRPVDELCLDDSSCAAGKLCIENLCVPEDEACQIDAQCTVGFACLDQRCVFLCDEAQTRCPSGTVCESGRCEPTTGECRDSADCPDLQTNCVEGRCLRRCDRGCDEATEQCDSEGFCRPRSLPDPDQETPFCRSDADCDGTRCVEGICRTPCDAQAPDPNTVCESFDAQLPICGPDNLCYAE